MEQEWKLNKEKSKLGEKDIDKRIKEVEEKTTEIQKINRIKKLREEIENITLKELRNPETLKELDNIKMLITDLYKIGRGLSLNKKREEAEQSIRIC